MAPFGHLLTAMITPFTSSGEVDYEQTWRLARFLVEKLAELGVADLIWLRTRHGEGRPPSPDADRRRRRR